jgi:hypothetical protein
MGAFMMTDQDYGKLYVDFEKIEAVIFSKETIKVKIGNTDYNFPNSGDAKKYIEWYLNKNMAGDK